MNAVKDKKGVTLIELIVVIAIMGIILTTISGIFIYIPGFFKKANAHSALQSDAIVLMENIEINLRTATEVQFGGTAPDSSWLNLKAFDDQYDKLSVNYSYDTTDKNIIKVTISDSTGSYNLEREIFMMNGYNETTNQSASYIIIKKP